MTTSEKRVGAFWTCPDCGVFTNGLPAYHICPESIIKRHEKALRLVAPRDADPHLLCFYHVLAMRHVFAEKKGGRYLPQAGSASFRFVAEHLDDGVSPTHYSYVYEGWDDLLRFPEIHCWGVWVPGGGEDPILIDTTTKFVPELAKRKGMVWTEEFPPEYLWTTDCRSKRFYYEPVKDACLKLAFMIQNMSPW